MKVLIACESSGRTRDAFRARGHDAWSCDLLPCEKGGNWHIQGDVLGVLAQDWDLMIAHPSCTYLTCSAEWAYKAPDYDRYPGVGYHQKVKPGTLVGEERRQARREAVEFVKTLWNARIPRVAIENPIGALSREFMQPTQFIQPYEYGDDASKRTCLWLRGLSKLQPTQFVEPRIVIDKQGKPRQRWANQTDSGQNRLSPSEDRWQVRSKTYQGWADAFAAQWG